MAQGHFADEFLKPVPVFGGSGRAPLIVIDGVDALDRPAERNRVITQRVLAPGAFCVLQYLTQRALAYVQVRLPLEVRRGDLVVHLEVHKLLAFWHRSAISVSNWTISLSGLTDGRWRRAIGGGLGSVATGFQLLIQDGRPCARNSAKPRGVTDGNSPVACARSASYASAN